MERQEILMTASSYGYTKYVQTTCEFKYLRVKDGSKQSRQEQGPMGLVLWPDHWRHVIVL